MFARKIFTCKNSTEPLPCPSLCNVLSTERPVMRSPNEKPMIGSYDATFAAPAEAGEDDGSSRDFRMALDDPE